MLRPFSSLMGQSDGARVAVRVILFIYLALLLCPIQYWPFIDNPDNSWYFAVNYAAAHHLAAGRDIVSTAGPLGYLAIPQDIGNNLAWGLAFQTVVWVLVVAIVWGFIYRSGVPLRNLIFFTAFLALSAKLYQYPNPLGAADLLLAGALVLLVRFQMQGGMRRYIAALLMLGFVPLIKFVGLFTIAGVISGVIVYQIFQRRKGARLELTLAFLVPASVVTAGYWLTMGSFHTVADYLRSSAELSSGYSVAMSMTGSPVELIAAFEAFLLLVIAVAWLARSNSRMALFLGLLLALPLAVNIKHAFVRQDSAHVMHWFCFIALSHALLSLAIPLRERIETAKFAVLLLLFSVLWQDTIARDEPRPAVAAITGIRTASMIWPVLPFGDGLRHALQSMTDKKFPVEKRIEPEIRAILGAEPVASLSASYSDMLIDGLNPVLYPVVLRYSAYTPYLDRLNADWIRDKAPRFLIFNGGSIDNRHPWLETPAMWMEVYRWYNLRFLGPRNLLLERRKMPKFMGLELVARAQVEWGEELRPPASSRPIFWTMQCSLSKPGKARQWLFRVPEVTLELGKSNGQDASFRVIPAVLISPSPGNYLPTSLEEFASVFNAEAPNIRVEKFRLGGPGTSSYLSNCELQWLRPD